jgi:hypothetical protein
MNIFKRIKYLFLPKTVCWYCHESIKWWQRMIIIYNCDKGHFVYHLGCYVDIFKKHGSMELTEKDVKVFRK